MAARTKKAAVPDNSEPEDIRVLALDPGKNEFAYCFSRAGKIKNVGMFKHTLTDMREHRFMHEVKGFVQEVEKFIESLGKIDIIVVERYTSRPGKGGGSVSESINVMIGLLSRYCHRKNIAIQPIMSSQWKNRFRARDKFDTQAERYGFPVSKTKSTEPILDHEFDATGINQWYCECRPMRGVKPANRNLLESYRKQIAKLWKQRLAVPVNGKPKDPQTKQMTPEQVREHVEKLKEEAARKAAEKKAKPKQPKKPKAKRKTAAKPKARK